MVNIADNTGAKLAQVFKVLGGSKKRYAQLGEIVVVSIKTAEPRKMVKKKKSITPWWSGKKTLSGGKTGRMSGLTRMPWCFWIKLSTNRWGKNFRVDSERNSRKRI